MPRGLKLLACAGALLALAACDDDGDDDGADLPFGSAFEEAFDQDPNAEPIEVEDDAGLTVEPTAEPVEI